MKRVAKGSAAKLRSHEATDAQIGVLGGCGFNRDRSRRVWNAKLKNTAAGWIRRHPQPTAGAPDGGPPERPAQAHALRLCREQGVKYAVEHLQIESRAGVFDYGQYFAIP